MKKIFYLILSFMLVALAPSITYAHDKEILSQIGKDITINGIKTKAVNLGGRNHLVISPGIMSHIKKGKSTTVSPVLGLTLGYTQDINFISVGSEIGFDVAYPRDDSHPYVTLKYGVISRLAIPESSFLGGVSFVVGGAASFSKEEIHIEPYMSLGVESATFADKYAIKFNTEHYFLSKVVNLKLELVYKF
ncbi:hypothetical protein [Bartonella sp. DGB1]|uniref:hypothetical protein n=1 Tax=Bartonella sp. DGB1 TaxID=3239807 RepID=UPI0035259E5C